MVNKGSSFADFMRFRPHTYPRTQKSLPPLWAAIILLFNYIIEENLFVYVECYLVKNGASRFSVRKKCHKNKKKKEKKKKESDTWMD